MSGQYVETAASLVTFYQWTFHDRISLLPTSFVSVVARTHPKRLRSATTSTMRWVASGTCLAIIIPVSTNVKGTLERCAS